MNLRNIIELMIVLITAAVSVPVFLNLHRRVKDLDGFDVLEQDNPYHDDGNDDNIIMIK